MEKLFIRVLNVLKAYPPKLAAIETSEEICCSKFDHTVYFYNYSYVLNSYHRNTNT